MEILIRIAVVTQDKETMCEYALCDTCPKLKNVTNLITKNFYQTV